jgi:biotin-(acetyl-CoA carboxylase) ligase
MDIYADSQAREVMKMKRNTRVSRVPKRTAERIRKAKRNGHKSKLNKFYCSAVHISEAIADNRNDEWTRNTLEAATRHAKQLIEDEGRECVAIVKIVRIVRKETPPVSVEEVD